MKLPVPGSKSAHHLAISRMSSGRSRADPGVWPVPRLPTSMILSRAKKPLVSIRLRQRLVEVLRCRGAEQRQVRLVDVDRLFLIRFHANRIDVAGRGVERQQDVRDRLAAVFAVEIDLPKHAVHLVVLKQHPAGADERVLDAFARCELVAERSGHADLKQNLRIDFARKFLAGSAAGESEQVEICAQVTGRANLATGQKRLQRHRAAERQTDVRVRCIGEREVHDSANEARNIEQSLGDLTWIENDVAWWIIGR